MTRAKKSSSKSSRLTTKLFIKPKSAKALPKPDPPAFDSLPVSSEQCRKAINALVAHGKKRAIEREATDLLADEDDEALWLNVATKRMSPKDHPKPIRIAVPHPLLDPRKNPVCLLVKDPQREYKDLLESKNVKFISRVVGMEKLQGKFKAFEARRQLMKEHDLFLVDDRIMAEMPRVLGKKWLQAKKSPVPVNLQRADLKGNLERAIASAYLRLNTGNATAIKIGYLSRHSIDELCDNLMAAIPHLAVHMPMGGWDNIQGLSIKLSTSASLPIWQCSLNTAGEKDSSSRFYIADVNEEEIAAKKAAHEAKQQRIKDKKARKLGKKGEDGVKSIEAAPESEDVPEAAEAASSEVATPAKSPQRPSAKADKPSKSDRKTVSSTSKASKGMSTVKGFPQKTKKSKSA